MNRVHEQDVPVTAYQNINTMDSDEAYHKQSTHHKLRGPRSLQVSDSSSDLSARHSHSMDPSSSSISIKNATGTTLEAENTSQDISNLRAYDHSRSNSSFSPSLSTSSISDNPYSSQFQTSEQASLNHQSKASDNDSCDSTQPHHYGLDSELSPASQPSYSEKTQFLSPQHPEFNPSPTLNTQTVSDFDKMSLNSNNGQQTQIQPSNQAASRRERKPVKRRPVSSLYIPTETDVSKGSPSSTLSSLRTPYSASSDQPSTPTSPTRYQQPATTLASPRILSELTSSHSQPIDVYQSSDTDKASIQRRSHWTPATSNEEMKRNHMVSNHASNNTQFQNTQESPYPTQSLQQNSYSKSHQYHSSSIDEMGTNNLVTGKRSSVLYLDPNSATPNFSTPTNFRNSTQFPPDFSLKDQEYQRTRPVSSIELPTNTSFDPDTGKYNGPYYDNNAPSSNSNSYLHIPVASSASANRSSIAVGVPKYANSEFTPSSLKKWKYHIQKNMCDFYMTTNPNADHINAPKAPTYYVEMKEGDINNIPSFTFGKHKGSKELASRTFSMSLIDINTQFKEVTITRTFRPDMHGGYEDYYDIIVFQHQELLNQSEQFDFNYSSKSDSMNKESETDVLAIRGPDGERIYPESKGGITSLHDEESVVAWRAQAFPVPPQEYYGVASASNGFSSAFHYHSLKPMISNAGSSIGREFHSGMNSISNITGFSFGGEKHGKEERVSKEERKENDSFKQYSFFDDRGRKWIVGNRQVQIDSEIEGQEDFDSDTNGGLDLNTKPVKNASYEGSIHSSSSGGNVDSNYGTNGALTTHMRVKKGSTRVYFFSPGANGPQSDKLMAVLRRRKQIHKQIAKDISRFAHRATASISDMMREPDEGSNSNSNNTGNMNNNMDNIIISNSSTGAGNEESTGKKSFFRNLVSSSGSKDFAMPTNASSAPMSYSNNSEWVTPNSNNQFPDNLASQAGLPMGITYANIPENPLDMAEEEDQDKFGWLTMFENVKNRPGLWPVVTAMTMAVAYAQRVDTRERSLQEKFKTLGRRYKEARKHVHYGHQNTKSNV